MTEHRFATRVAWIDLDQAAPAAPRPHPLSLWRRFVRLVQGIGGLDAYDRYLEHQRRTGCDDVLSQGEFWKLHWAEQDRNPKARCC